ncbi:hypothetical protein DPMN_071778 [Dreissena polymorpha]|uniref:Uncharacterized protein n=1 Tax=Dreissena polymorpha TaxID=45954 RepID=A0A9D4BWG5_DREPO|nr:hypothetical protein DPMN_071778 [Dreissena polymorpha]
MGTSNFKAIPDLCREQGRTITIDDIKGSIHISRANVIPKDSPFKKRVRLQESSSVDDQHDPLSNVALGQKFMEESNGTRVSGCRDNTDNVYEELVTKLSKVLYTLFSDSSISEKGRQTNKQSCMECLY